MNKKRPLLMVLSFVIFSQLLYAQSEFHARIIAGVSFNTPDNGVFDNWGNGWTIGGSVSLRISSSIDLALNLMYSRYPYQGDNLQLAGPAVLGFESSVTGQHSRVLEVSATGRFTASGRFINPFFTVTVGLDRFSIGEILVSRSFDSDPQNVFRSIYKGSGISTTRGLAGLGVGFSISLAPSARVAIEGRFVETIGSQESFLPLLASVELDL